MTITATPSHGAVEPFDRWYQDAKKELGLSEDDHRELELDVKMWFGDYLSMKRPISWVFERCEGKYGSSPRKMMLAMFVVGGLWRWTSFLIDEVEGVTDEMERVSQMLGLTTNPLASGKNGGAFYG